MKPYVLMLITAGWMIAMAITGYVRTGSPTALYIMGSIGLVTGLFGWLIGQRIPSALSLAGVVWFLLVSGVLVFMTVKRISAHSEVRTGSELIFGSTALFAIITLVMLAMAHWKGKAQ